MSVFAKRIISLCLIIVIASILLCGCAKKTLSLHVVIEDRSEWWKIVNDAAREFETEHKGVSIIVKELTTDETAREIALQQMRTAIMAGKGPDVFLLPCSWQIDNPLFPDVSQAMRNGLFADLSEYYDTDMELGKDGLIPAVMDAGMVDGARYVLPLRYNIPVAYVDLAQFEEAGLSPKVFDTGLEGLMRAVVESDDDDLAAAANPFRILYDMSLNVFTDLLDYDEQKINLTKEELAEFMELYQALEDLQSLRSRYLGTVDFLSYLTDAFPHWATYGEAMFISDMDLAFANAAVAQIEGIDFDIFPLRSSDGTLTADVTLWGAVGTSCEETELAYQFLTYFLSEDLQWQEDIEEPNGLHDGLIESGWPVRTRNGIWQLFKNISLPISSKNMNGANRGRAQKLKFVELKDDDFPDFHTEIDQARFSIPAEETFARILREDLNNWTTGEAKNVDLDALAETVIKELEWHLYEG